MARYLVLFFRFLIYPLIIVGFVYQVSLVTSEYFRYVTITHVAVKDSLTENIPPRIHLCKFPRTNSGYGNTTLSYLFSSRDSPMSDSMNIIEVGLLDKDLGERGNVKNGSLFEVRRFLNRELYCISFRPAKRMVYKPEVYFATPLTAVAMMVFNSTFLQRPKTCNDEDTGKCLVSLGMASYDSDLQKPMKTPLVTWVNASGTGMLDWSVTYSLTTTTLVPAPYDTNCFKYSEIGHSSQHACLADCIAEGTKKWGFIPQGNYVIVRELYQDSNVTLLPYFLDEGDKPMTPEQLNSVFGTGMINFKPLYLEFRNIRLRCHKICSHPDCHTETVTPQEIQITHFSPGHKLIKYSLTLHPPKEPAVVVISTPKVGLMDFLIYICSCLSFWYGFCPLGVAKYVQGEFRKNVQNKNSKRDNIFHLRRQ